MKTRTLAINTDFFGENPKLEVTRQLLHQIASAGFTHIHWCHEWDGDYMYSVYEMQQIREWMEECHLQAKALHATKGTRRNVIANDGHFRRDFTSDWEYNRKAGVELIQNRVDLAACLGASEIVLHLYIPFQTIGEDAAAKEHFYRQVEASLDELQPYCLQKGVRICLENLFDLPGSWVLESFDRLLGKYPKEFLGICLDTGHANMSWGTKFCDIIRTYRDRIYAVHLHDNFGDADAHALPGEGNIPWDEVMRTLASSAYALPLLLELNCSGSDPEAFLRRAFEAGQKLSEQFCLIR